MKKLFYIIFLNFFFICTLSNVLAQGNEDYKKHSGYVDFGNFDKFKNAEETVEVLIKGPLLKFVSKATVYEDPELSRLLDDLVVIKVNVFSIENKQTDEVKAIIDEVSKKLESKNWERMVRVKEPKEKVEIFTHFDKNNDLSGLAIMSVEEGDEAAFVNIAGKINPEELGKLSRKFNIPQLDSVNIQQKKK